MSEAKTDLEKSAIIERTIFDSENVDARTIAGWHDSFYERMKIAEGRLRKHRNILRI